MTLLVSFTDNYEVKEGASFTSNDIIMMPAVFFLLLSSILLVTAKQGLKVNFHNNFEHPISIYWVGSLDNNVHMFDIEPKQDVGVNTFVNDKFYATELGDTVALEYQMMQAMKQTYSWGSGTVGQCDANGVCDNVAMVAESAAVPKGANDKGEPIKVQAGDCFDRHAVCKDYVAHGECNKNPGWMIVNCPVSCEACHLLDPKVRCQRARMNISDVPIYAPGDLNAMFSSIKEKFDDRYGVTVHSETPWVVTFDNFLTDDEVNALIDTVEGTWERSTDTGTANEFGEVGRVLSTGRTSSNAWCRNKCESHPSVRRVQEKITEITGIPAGHSESFQVLKYDLGQKYNAHMDYSGGAQGELACGPRILTFFLYLSDVEEGGETAFPLLDIAVKPKKGKALLWPSVVDDDLKKHEPLSLHEARPVVKGRKYAANSWIHLYDYNIPNLHGCTGTFDVL